MIGDRSSELAQSATVALFQLIDAKTFRCLMRGSFKRHEKDNSESYPLKHKFDIRIIKIVNDRRQK